MLAGSAYLIVPRAEVTLYAAGREFETIVLVSADPEIEEVDQVNQVIPARRVGIEIEGAAADRIGGAGTGWATWERVMEEGMILAAALATGGAEYALDITVQYSKDREQFDKPLGAFQALAHYMADAKTAIDGAKILVYEAAWAHSVGKPLARLAPMAKLFACNTYRDTTAMAQQIFGGVGFTLEYEIQLYFRRAKQLQLSWNDTRRCEDLIAAAVLDGEGDDEAA